MRSLDILSVLVGLATTVFATHSSVAAETCTGLQRQLGTSIVQTPSGPEYLNASSGAWNFFNAIQRPACVVFPVNSGNVQTAMSAIFKNHIRYAVQAGSHTAMQGWNNVQDGILIIFSNMASVSFNATENSITLQPGVHWGDALSAVEPFGVAPMGGRLGDVGTGLLLGGGLSYLAGRHGFSVDALIEADVVLVNGTIVTATATNSFSDLFRALKGGANRFGIVTRYKVTAIEVGTSADLNFFGGIIEYDNSSTEAVLTATANYVLENTDPDAVLLLAIESTTVDEVTTTTPVLTAFYRGTELPPAIFGEFLAIPALVSELVPLSYIEVASILGAGNERLHGQTFGASAFNGPASQYIDAFRKWNSYTQSVKDNINGTALAFTPIPQSQILAGRLRGGNAIAPPDGPYAAVQVQTQFPIGVTSISPVITGAHTLLLNQIPRNPGLPLYMNECDASQNVFATYGDLQFLRNTYAKYDPTRFNVRFTDGPIGL